MGTLEGQHPYLCPSVALLGFRQASMGCLHPEGRAGPLCEDLCESGRQEPLQEGNCDLPQLPVTHTN